MEKHIRVTLSASYKTYGNYTPAKTQRIWVACHGYGQLARHFIKRFDIFSPTADYVIAPQGLSHFYIEGTEPKVGASWMTREDREVSIANQFAYLDAVFDHEIPASDLANKQLYLMGFSQGVSTISRWMVYRKLPFDKLILWAGIFPLELKAEALTFIPEKSQIHTVMGSSDRYYTPESYQKEQVRLHQLFGREIHATLFEGKHVVTRDVLSHVAAY